ncbi:MAG: hypothetical protein ACN4GZ_06215 [Acidimicrobiales bacterium]
MNFSDIGPLQLLVIGFGPDAEFEGLILDELDRLTARGLIRVIDMQFITKEEGGDVVALEFVGLDEDELDELGAVVDRLMGLTGGISDELMIMTEEEQSFGIGPEELAGVAAGLQPGDAVAVLLFEHVWATELKAAVRATGGVPLAQGFLTPEALFMVGAEVQAIAEAEAVIELADAVSGAAMLDAMRTVEVAEDIKALAAVEAVQALIVAGLVADAAAEQALDALIAAELVEEAAVEAAAQFAAEATRESDEAKETLLAAAGEE